MMQRLFHLNQIKEYFTIFIPRTKSFESHLMKATLSFAINQENLYSKSSNSIQDGSAQYTKF